MKDQEQRAKDQVEAEVKRVLKISATTVATVGFCLSGFVVLTYVAPRLF